MIPSLLAVAMVAGVSAVDGAPVTHSPRRITRRTFGQYDISLLASPRAVTQAELDAQAKRDRKAAKRIVESSAKVPMK